LSRSVFFTRYMASSGCSSPSLVRESTRLRHNPAGLSLMLKPSGVSQVFRVIICANARHVQGVFFRRCGSAPQVVAAIAEREID
jgi:hypothetical protein